MSSVSQVSQVYYPESDGKPRGETNGHRKEIVRHIELLEDSRSERAECEAEARQREAEARQREAERADREAQAGQRETEARLAAEAEVARLRAELARRGPPTER